MILAEVLLAVVGGVLVAELKSLAQAPAACVVEVDEFEDGGGAAWLPTSCPSSVCIRSSGDSGGDPKIDPDSEPGSGALFVSGVQKDVQGFQEFASVGSGHQAGVSPSEVLYQFVSLSSQSVC